MKELNHLNLEDLMRQYVREGKRPYCLKVEMALFPTALHLTSSALLHKGGSADYWSDIYPGLKVELHDVPGWELTWTGVDGALDKIL